MKRMMMNSVVMGCVAAMVIGVSAMSTRGQEAATETAAAPSAINTTVTVVSATGQARWRMMPDGAWQEATAGTVLEVGAEVQTGLRSEVKLQIGEGAEAVVGALADVVVADVSAGGDNVLHSRLAMKFGKVKFNVQQVGYANDFKIATPSGVMAVRGTGGTVTSYSGPAVVEGDKGNVLHSIDNQYNNGEEQMLSGDESSNNGDQINNNPQGQNGNNGQQYSNGMDGNTQSGLNNMNGTVKDSMLMNQMLNLINENGSGDE